MKRVLVVFLSLLMLMTSVIIPGAFTASAAEITNLYNSNTLSIGWVNGSGQTSPDGAFYTTAPIYVNEGDVMYFGAAVSTQGWHIVTLHESGSVIGDATIHTGINIVENIDSTTSIMKYTIPAGVAGLRFVVDARYKDKYIITKNQPFSVSDYNSYMNGKLTNLYDETNSFAGYIDGSGNQVAGSGFITLAAVSVAQNDVVTFGAAVKTQGFHIVLINSSNVVTGVASINNGIAIGAAIDASTSIMTYTIPAGVTSIRMIVDTNYKTKYLYTINRAFTLDEYNTFFSINNDGDDGVNTEISSSPLYQKRALFCGDSISYGQWDEPSGNGGWGKRIGVKYNMTVTNNSMGGYSLSTCRPGRIIDQLNAAKNNTYDYVILQGGVNDAWGTINPDNTTTPAAPGAMTNSTNVADFDTTTYAGGLEELFYYAKQYFPNAKIGYIVTFATPLATGIGNTTNMEPYYSEGLKICDKWGIQVLDLYHNRYISNEVMKVNTYTCLRDPIHPNVQGYENLTPYIEDWMARMVDNSVYANNHFINKRALFCGDSISYGHNDTPQGKSWAGRIQDSIKIIADNQSNSGWSLSTIRGAQIVQQLERVRGNRYDYVILHGGINDAWSGADIGQITDSYDPKDFDVSTYAGALENLFYYAYNYFPDAAIGYIINFKLAAITNPAEGTYADMAQYVPVAKQICAKWKVPYLNLHEDDYVTNTLLQTALYGEGTKMADAGHPNKAGYDALSPYIETWFKTIKYADISSFESKMAPLSENVVKLPYVRDGVMYVNECDSLSGWGGAFNTSFSLDKENKNQGVGSIASIGKSPSSETNKISDTHYVGSMLHLKFGQGVDLSGYDKIVYEFYIPDMTGKQGFLQLNFATTGEDGYNTTYDITNKAAGWYTAEIATNLSAFNAVAFEWNNIKTIRFTWWNLNASVTGETTILIDNIRMVKNLTDDMVNEVIAAIDDIGTVNAQNFSEKLSLIEKAETKANALIGAYGDNVKSRITNYQTLLDARAKYNAYVSAEELYAYGDLNDDGSVTASDALFALQYAVNKLDLNDAAKEAADVDGSGDVTSSDALMILQKAVEIIDSFPIEQ